MTSKSMVQDGKTAITIKVPTSLYNSLVNAVNQGKYPSQTAGVITALEHDLDESTITIEELQKTIKKQASELAENDKTIQKLALDISTSNANCAGLKQLINEKDTRIADLHKQNEQLDSQIESKDRLLEAQAIQMQILLNQKAIEVPGVKKPWWQFW